jgi:ankyrin repeat protein
MSMSRLGSVDTDTDSNFQPQDAEPWTQARIDRTCNDIYVWDLGHPETGTPQHVLRMERALRAGFPFNSSDSRGIPALIHATRTGNLPLVRHLLQAGADPNVRITMSIDNCRNTPLIDLCEQKSMNSRELVEVLVAAGADVEARTGAGLTALCYAAQADNLQAAKALVAAGADVNARRIYVTEFPTIPYDALRACRRDTSVLKYLLSLPQLDLDSKNTFGLTPEAQARNDGRHEVAAAIRAASAIRAARWTPLRSAWVAAVAAAAAAATTAASTRSSLKRQREEST